jgi:hypothetical protein
MGRGEERVTMTMPVLRWEVREEVVGVSAVSRAKLGPRRMADLIV